MKPVILLADDSSTIQRLVERTFDGSPFGVVAVSNGEAAVRELAHLRPAAVLADIHMPGRNGYELCRHVKGDPSLAGIPVVLLVGAFEVFDETLAESAGADRTITKPFEPRQLSEAVAALVGDVPAAVSAVPEFGPGSEAARQAPLASPAPRAVAEAVTEPEASDEDILGLRELFPEPGQIQPRRALSEEEVDAIADRVLERLSSEVVESIAWDIVPEIANRVMEDERKHRK